VGNKRGGLCCKTEGGKQDVVTGRKKLVVLRRVTLALFDVALAMKYGNNNGASRPINEPRLQIPWLVFYTSPRPMSGCWGFDGHPDIMSKYIAPAGSDGPSKQKPDDLDHMHRYTLYFTRRVDWRKGEKKTSLRACEGNA
jgi:hypothetical protein